MKIFNSYVVRKLGHHRGAPRIWLEGRLPVKAGFQPCMRYSAKVDRTSKVVTLSADMAGNRVVSSKQSSTTRIPVIDINSMELLSAFEGLESVKITVGEGFITIQPLETEARLQERVERFKSKLETGLPLSVGSMSHGGGVLSKAVHDGFGQAGIKTKLSFANDIREDFLNSSAERNAIWDDQTMFIAAPMQEMAFDFSCLAALPQVDVLELGLPCRGASVSGRAKNAISCAEAHPEVGHLVVAFLAMVAKVNPSAIIFENVKPYFSSASIFIIKNQLRDFGYECHEHEVFGNDWGVLESRRRKCLVAVSKGIEFDFSKLSHPITEKLKLGDLMDDVPENDECWSEMLHLKAKQERDASEGKGFAMQIVNPSSTQVGVIGAGYSKVRSTEPKIQHPTNPNLLRQLTVGEHARVMGISEKLVEGLPKTIAHEILGQSVNPAPFVAIAKLVCEALINSVKKGLVKSQCKSLAAVSSGDQPIKARLHKELTSELQGMLF